FLVGTRFQAFPIAAAAFLIDEHNAVLGPFINGVARACRQAGWVRAMVADPGQVKEPGLVLRQSLAGLEVLAFGGLLRTSGVILESVWGGPFLIRGQVAQCLLC